ncbi:hypothetical protein CIW49_20625 [Mycolicibacterium sp. P1-18]|uniref:hypothetical protein n=1 Tax=Mycolicibacterium sp. P1-18 TaxID=2024615 RepID=UPI0011F1E0D0|nr:hypothetical protein [Mycolicibacterium sp. P1-18]KAA0095957.1 hypothetical protein CIW49_20625 [Mycolicibacterium sp. P1-18]
MTKARPSMTTTSRTTRAAAAALLAGAGALAGTVLSPATAQADPGRATGPFTWCPGQYQGFTPSGPGRPNWDWNVCHTYWWVYGEPGGNVAESVWEGGLPPAQIPLENLTRPPVNCGLFFCQDPGGRYTVDPRI